MSVEISAHYYPSFIKENGENTKQKQVHISCE